MKSGGRARRIIVGSVIVIAGVNVIAWVLGSVAPTPGGPTSSSYATGPDGLAAYAELLARSGYDVSRLREEIADADPDPDTTLVVLDARGLTQEDTRVLGAFMERGGRLVAGGVSPTWLDELVPRLRWSPTPVRAAAVLAPVDETAGVTTVVTAGNGSFAATGPALPVVGTGREAVAAVGEVGAGTLAAVADASPLQNAYLGRADNAALGLGLAGDASRPVVMAESVHGYDAATGLAALPDRWKWALGLGLVAALTMMWARARRLGPPEHASRDLPPPRAAYVDSIAGILARSGRPAEALSGLRQEALDAGGVGEGTGTDVATLAGAAGLSEGQHRVLAEGVTSEGDGILAARALARIKRTFGGKR